MDQRLGGTVKICNISRMTAWTVILYAISELLAGVAAIGQQAFNPLQIRPTAVNSQQGPAAIGRLGGSHGDGMWHPLSIYSDVPFDAGHFLPVL